MLSQVLNWVSFRILNQIMDYLVQLFLKLILQELILDILDLKMVKKLFKIWNDILILNLKELNLFNGVSSS